MHCAQTTRTVHRLCTVHRPHAPSAYSAHAYKPNASLWRQVVANDLDPTATEALRVNLKLNQLSEERVVPHTGDAVTLMHRSRPVSAAGHEPNQEGAAVLGTFWHLLSASVVAAR